MSCRFPSTAALGLLAALSAAALTSVAAAEETSEAAFHRAFFLQTHQHDYVAAAAAFQQVASDEQAPDQLKQAAATRMAQCREESAAEDLARLMPADALAYLELTRPGEHLQKLLGMLGLVRQGEPADKAGPVERIPLGSGLSLPTDFSVSPALLAEMKRLRGVAVAVTSVDPQQEEIQGVLVLHPGEDNNLRGQIETAVQLLTPGEPIEGFRVHHYQGQVWVALTARLVVVADSREKLAAVAQRLKDPQAENLASRKDFQRCRADAQDALLFAYVSGQQAIRQFGSQLRGPEAMIARTVLDFDHLESLTMVAGVTDSGILLEARLNLAEGSRNLAYALVRTAPLSKRSLKYVPSGTAAVVLLGLNPAGDPAADAARSTVQAITAMDLGREVFDNIEELAVFALPPSGTGSPGSPIPEVALVVAVKDAGKSEALWTQLLSLPGLMGIGEFPPPREVTIEGVQAKAYPMPEGPPIVVARVGDRALVAGTEPAVAAAIRTSKSGGGILRDAAFQPLLDRLGPTASKAVLVNMGRAVRLATVGAPRQHAAELMIAGAALKDLNVSAVTDEGSTHFAMRVEATGLPNVLEIAKMFLTAQRHQAQAARRAAVDEAIRAAEKARAERAAAAPAVTLADLRSLGPQGWRDLVKKSINLEGKLIVTDTNLGKDGLPTIKNAPATVRKIAFKYSHDGFVNKTSRELDNGATRASAQVMNPQSAFVIVLPPDSDEWIIKSLTKPDKGNSRRYVQERGFLRLLESQWSLLGAPLEKLIAEKGFDLRSISSVRGHPNLVQVDFDCKEPKSASWGPLTVNSIAGTMVLDRDRSWCLTNYDVHVDTSIGEEKKPFRMWAQAEVHYDLRDQAMSPQRAIFKRRDPDGGDGSQTVFEVAELTHRAIDPSELTLSAFNLESKGSVPIPLEDR